MEQNNLPQIGVLEKRGDDDRVYSLTVVTVTVGAKTAALCVTGVVGTATKNVKDDFVRSCSKAGCKEYPYKTLNFTPTPLDNICIML